MGRILRSGGLLYFVILIVLAVVLVNMLSRGNPDVAELNSQQWNQAVQDKTFDTSLEKTNENYLTIYDEDQTVRGQLNTDSGNTKEFEYSYTQMTDVASQLDKADVPYSVDPQN
ncbi:MAG: cell division protein FtsH, partial [Actinomycetota bacterium]|nr:cell division protein FtsH [Actinomycetota bacterium]